ncbi:MAG: hypothetical protein GY710_04535 [Desulfobacteraceae bacterium]|nr:hypothetical protein [Desulfobacteraceae bacterium]
MRKLVIRCKGDAKYAGSILGKGFVKNPTAFDSNMDFIEFEPQEGYAGKINFPHHLRQRSNITYEWIYFYGHHGNFRVLKQDDSLYLKRYQKVYAELEREFGSALEKFSDRYYLNKTLSVSVDYNMGRSADFIRQGKYEDAIRSISMALKALKGKVESRIKAYGPSALSGRNYAVTSQFVNELKKRSIKAKLILLDCCWSAGFIPLMSQVLTQQGCIFAYPCPDMTPIGLHKSLKNAIMDVIEMAKNIGSDFGMKVPGIVQVFYLHKLKTIFRENRCLDTAKHVSYGATNEELCALDEYLALNKIKISTVSQHSLLYKMKQGFFGVHD